MKKDSVNVGTSFEPAYWSISCFIISFKAVSRLNHVHVLSHDQAMHEGESISNQPIPFSMDRDGHDFHALFQYMFYTWV